MKRKLLAPLLVTLLTAGSVFSAAPITGPAPVMEVTGDQMVRAFARQGIRLSPAEGVRIQDEVELALSEARQHGIGNSKVDFAAVEIASSLGLETGPGSNTVRNIVAALDDLLKHPGEPSRPLADWDTYFSKTVSLTNDSSFISLMEEKQFFPVHISWEDIGRYENSVWGDRISDVGIWVRRRENDAASAELALSVRRDSNFRDKVLMVPSEKIKVHVKENGRTIERTLPQRLQELGLTSKTRDKHVIVSNQFAIVPVPDRQMRGAWKKGTPPRVAFNFSIFPYGSTNFVITDVLEGSSEAVVGPGTHQMLYANVKGKKAPFTASRAEDRQDLLKLEAALKAQGMDVDVQRYYLIQIPLQRDVKDMKLSNMGTPPGMEPEVYEEAALDAVYEGVGGGAGMATGAVPMAAPPSVTSVKAEAPSSAARSAVTQASAEEPAGLSRVAIGTGEVEGKYFAGSGFRGARAEEPIRVTVVYFVTPVGEVSKADMENFTRAFTAWDSQAIWGGSFVTKETN